MLRCKIIMEENEIKGIFFFLFLYKPPPYYYTQFWTDFRYTRCSYTFYAISSSLPLVTLLKVLSESQELLISAI